MAKGTGCLTDGEMAYDNSSRIEPKRAHQWLLDATEPELFPNKKQAIEASNSKSISGLSSANIPSWENASSFQSVSGQFTDRLFGSEAARTISFGGRNIPSVGTGNLSMGRKGIENQFGNDSSVGLSMSHTMEDPGSYLSYGGIRKVKINQVKESDNGVSASMVPTYNRGDTNSISMGHPYNKGDNNIISIGQPYSRGDDIAISMGQLYNRGEDNTISMGQPYNRGDGNTIAMGQLFSRGDDNTTSICQPFNNVDDNISMGHHAYNRGDGNIISMGHIYNKGDGSIISMGQSYNQEDGSTISMVEGDGNIISMGHSYNKGDGSNISTGHTYKEDASTISMGNTYNKGDKNTLSIGHTTHTYKDNNTISFGSFHGEPETNPSGRLIGSYDLFMSQSTVEPSQTLNEKEVAELNADILISNAQIVPSGTEAVSKNKTDLKSSKKMPPNNFPSNVKSLLSTGMLDGVPVKYISWSREKELRGIIKGSGYLCGCQPCNFSKALNAYEFERHSGCKTKHPNNHIFFENGKTIYGIVQELRSTPQHMLFEAIQTVTGSTINQRAFRIWKESFQAATRELQRIFGKDEANQQHQTENF